MSLNSTEPLERNGDRRVQRSRAALKAAFVELILQRGYDAVGPADVALQANVGRSTFYDHFKGMDELLRFSIDHHLLILAASSLKPDPDKEILRVVEHFWEHRRFAKAMFVGTAGMVVQQRLCEHLETGIGALPQAKAAHPKVRAKLLAIQIAASQTALLEAWLAGRASASSAVIAETIHRGSYALVHFE